MQLIENKLYHFYNQGNNKEKIFYCRENRLFFLRKFRKYVSPCSRVWAYCLMSNHFHFLLYTTADSIREKRVGGLTVTALSDGFRQLLSSYAQAINKQENRSGSLFRQKTRAKLLECGSEDYPFICFQYIHQNPYRAGLVDKMEEWEFSSFRDYINMRRGTLCDKALAFELLNLSKETFYEQSYRAVPEEKFEELF